MVEENRASAVRFGGRQCGEDSEAVGPADVAVSDGGGGGGGVVLVIGGVSGPENIVFGELVGEGSGGGGGFGFGGRESAEELIGG